MHTIDGEALIRATRNEGPWSNDHFTYLLLPASTVLSGLNSKPTATSASKDISSVVQSLFVW